MIWHKEENAMIEIIKKIITHVLTALYQPFGGSLIIAILIMFIYMFAEEHGWKTIIKRWIDLFKNKSAFREIFLLVFYTVLILFRTLLNRNMWMNPLSNVMGIWGLHNANGELTTEAIENLVLFIPFVILLFVAFRKKIIGDEVKFGIVLWKAISIVFLFSTAIEFLQLFLRLGTFQLSDLFYNTLGGLIGGLLYWIGYKVRFRKK